MNRIYFEKMSNCTGCGACKNICPTGAISISYNEKGFYAPILDESKCVNCGKCKLACPKDDNHLKNFQKPQCYAFAANDEERKGSSSGAFFPVLAKFILERKGYVCGVAWTKNFEAEHIIINNIEDLHKLRFSKYVQANTGNCFKEIKKILDKDNWVLFSGTPCQNAGLLKFLNKNYEKLITLDIICHGAPSPKVWQDYLNENFEKEKIVDINFRNKYRGWISTSEYPGHISFNDGTQKPIGIYYEAFLQHKLSNDPCVDCKYRKVPRPADFTCGDFWHLFNSDLNDNKGLSVVLLNNKKAEKIFNMIITNADIKLYEKIDLHNKYKRIELKNRSKKTIERELFFKKYQKGISTTKLLEATLGKSYDVGLCTFFNGLNYGSCLVAYAVNNILEKLGYSVLNIHKRVDSAYNFDERHLTYQFAKENYFVSDEIPFGEIPVTLNEKCNTFMLGSDTLWWWKDVEYTDNHFWLDFVFSSKKKIAFCTSFGFDEPNIPYLKQNEIKYLYKRFDALSTREASGARILKDYFDCNGECLCDPTLIADREIFEDLAIKSSREDKNYILAYVLDIDKRKQKQIENFANKMGIKLILIPNMYRSYKKEKKKKTKINIPIEDFLYLIKNAEFIITDSFHGVCFSTIFEKNFAGIINKQRGNGRYKIIEQIGLKKHLIGSFDELENYSLENMPNFQFAKQELEKQREKAFLWLKEALDKPKKESSDLDLFYDYQVLSNVNKLRNIKNLINLKLIKFKYFKYTLLENIFIGRKRKKAHEKRLFYKDILRRIG